jgi:hypothetical protein
VRWNRSDDGLGLHTFCLLLIIPGKNCRVAAGTETEFGVGSLIL